MQHRSFRQAPGEAHQCELAPKGFTHDVAATSSRFFGDVIEQLFDIVVKPDRQRCCIPTSLDAYRAWVERRFGSLADEFYWVCRARVEDLPRTYLDALRDPSFGGRRPVWPAFDAVAESSLEIGDSIRVGTRLLEDKLDFMERFLAR